MSTGALQSARGNRFTSLLAVVLSLLFWTGLGVSALLTAILVLSPRLFETGQLQQQYAENAQLASDLQKESEHLRQLAHALKTDADYRARVAASELKVTTPGQMHIPFSNELTYDPRLPPSSPPLRESAVEGWTTPLIELAALARPWRERVTISVAILILLTFTCFNASFFQGGLRQLVSSSLEGRYSRLSGQNENPQSVSTPHGPESSL